MVNYNIRNIQRKVLKMLPVDKKNRPSILLADSCSEISRLVASWIKASDKISQINILKGNNVCGTKKSHDILAVTDKSGRVQIIDPTVWQFFPRKKSIPVLTAKDINAAINKIKKIYSGRWKISEKFIKLSKSQEKKYLNIIKQNIKENLE